MQPNVPSARLWQGEGAGFVAIAFVGSAIVVAHGRNLTLSQLATEPDCYLFCTLKHVFNAQHGIQNRVKVFGSIQFLLITD